MISKSETFQYSEPPFGSGRWIIKGIFLCSNSRSAILYPSIISYAETLRLGNYL